MSVTHSEADISHIPPHPIPETEESPLLPLITPSTPSTSWYPPKHKPLIVVSLCTLCILILDFGVYIQLAPITRIFESIICKNYYDEHPEFGMSGQIPEAECKIAAIQSELAMLKGWQALFECLPSVFLTVPYGYMADKYGRKPVRILALLGLLLSILWAFIVCAFPGVFPIKLIWAGNICLIVGGGVGVFASLIFTSIADVVDEAERTPIFLRVAAVMLTTQMLAVPTGAALMDRELWLPMYIGLSILVLGVIVGVSIPETLKLDPELPESTSNTNDSEQELLISKSGTVFGQAIEAGRNTIGGFKAIFTSTLITALVFTFLVNSLGKSSADLYLQYASTRYRWKISQAAFFIPLRAGVQLGLLLLILPYLSHLLIKHGKLSVDKKDLLISRISVLLLMFGCIGIGLSPTPALMALFLIIYSLGSGFNVATRSLATSLVEPHHIGRLYAAMATLENVGGMIAGPFLSSLYSYGLSLDGGWVGLPFVASGVAYLSVAFPLWLYGLKSPRI